MNKQLQQFRKDNRIKQIELAKLSELSVQLLSKLENGWEDMTSLAYKKLINGYRKLGIDAEEELKNILNNNINTKEEINEKFKHT